MSIRGSVKYGSVCPATIESVVELEAGKQNRGSGAKRLAAGARKRLHKVAAFYLGETDHRSALVDLDKAMTAGDADVLADVCLRILDAHASSRERIPEMAELYRAIFDLTGVPEVLLDLACAYNPLAWRWMSLPRSTRYLAFDINARTVDLVAGYCALEGVAGGAELRDVVCSPVLEQADVALLLKMYHCLEHRERGLAWSVVEQIPATWVVVSFPVRNLANRKVDIAGNYVEEMRRRCSARGYEMEEIGFESEHVVIIHKDGTP